MNEIIIDTNTNQFHTKNRCDDPYDHLDYMEWVDKQIEYGSNELTVSGRGLLSELLKKENGLICCEIGVCHGFTAEYFLKNVPQIKKYYAIDHYPTFVDWNGTRLTQERQDEIKRRCFQRLLPFSEKLNFHYVDSVTMAEHFSENYFDFIFIDGDHSYNATLKDIQNYWKKVKSGGIFAGHDINLKSVQEAIRDFFGQDMKHIKIVENNAWYFIK